jgi:hypothetical protein
MKYHTVNANDSYEFNFANQLAYDATVRPNKYSNILADAVTVSAEPQVCELLFTATTLISLANFCEAENNVTTTPLINLTQTLSFTSVRL